MRQINISKASSSTRNLRTSSRQYPFRISAIDLTVDYSGSEISEILVTGAVETRSYSGSGDDNLPDPDFKLE